MAPGVILCRRLNPTVWSKVWCDKASGNGFHQLAESATLPRFTLPISTPCWQVIAVQYVCHKMINTISALILSI